METIEQLIELATTLQDAMDSGFMGADSIDLADSLVGALLEEIEELNNGEQREQIS